MAEENTDSVNLDLNLGPNDNFNDISEFGSGSYSSVALNLGNWLDRHGNGWVGHRVIRRNESSLSWRRDRNLFETGNAVTGLTSRGAPQTAPDGVVSEIRPVEISKISENRSGFSTNETLDKEGGKNYNDESGFFDCNICLCLAKEPVVTCCGHLFCWPCIYRWLQHHSIANECPVCKGRVTVKHIIPIYGPSPNTLESDVDLHMKIPPRPKARRVERLSQLIQRIRSVGNSSDFGPGIAPTHFQFYPPTTDLTTPISSSERVETEFFIRSHLQIDGMESNQEPAPPFEDTDSVSSIAAVIHPGGQMVDHAVEFDSTLSRSTSSSRRRNGASRNADVDSGDSRITRRRLY